MVTLPTSIFPTKFRAKKLCSRCNVAHTGHHQFLFFFDSILELVLLAKNSSYVLKNTTRIFTAKDPISSIDFEFHSSWAKFGKIANSKCFWQVFKCLKSCISKKLIFSWTSPYFRESCPLKVRHWCTRQIWRCVFGNLPLGFLRLNSSRVFDFFALNCELCFFKTELKFNQKNSWCPMWATVRFWCTFPA